MTAWETLIACNITQLPVDLRQICNRLGLGLYSYTQGYKLIQKYKLSANVHKTDGFLFREEDGPLAVVFYNANQPQGRRCFTIAHEIGHFVLGHQCHAGGVLRREPGNLEDPEEREANRYASQLLAPSCVLRGLGLRSHFEIMQTCRLSSQAAMVCKARMERLSALDEQYLTERGRSYFFQSPREWTLYRQFEPFIKTKAPRRPDKA